MTHLELCSLFTHKAGGGGGHPRGTWEVLSRDPHSAGGLGIFHTEPCTNLPSSLCLIHPTSKTLGQRCFRQGGSWLREHRLLPDSTQLATRRSGHQTETPTWAPNPTFLEVACVVRVIARTKTSTRMARVQMLFYDFSAAGFQASPLISQSLFPYLPQWRK